MNIIKVMGGIGNQFFQYAFGRVMSLNNVQVAYDISWCKMAEGKRYPRPFRLDKFNTELFIADFISKQPLVLDHRVGFNLSLFDLRDHNFEGYWQYLPYYVKILPILKNELQLKTEFYTDKFMEIANIILETEDSVAVHVRRGDYLTHKGIFRDLPAKYYFNALRSIPKGDLFIFSDDLPWCKDKFKPVYFNRKLYFVDLDDYLCFELMRLCKHKLICNSTFSYWAALLNDCGTVVRPRHWLGEMPERSDEIHYPKHWIKAEDYVNYKSVGVY